jgi:DNA-binding MurR/RpiR family transcriptional regulator
MSDVIRYRVLADKYAAAQEVVDDQATQLAAQQATIAQLAGDLGCADNQDLRTARDRLAARLAAVSDLVGAVAHALALHDTIMAATPPTSAMYHESRQRWEAMRTALAAVREEPGG